MDLGSMDVRFTGGWEDGSEDDGFEVDFDVDAGDMQDDVFCVYAGQQFVPLEVLDPKTRMYIELFAEGPPEGSDPCMN